jgi:hypothetical protein
MVEIRRHIPPNEAIISGKIAKPAGGRTRVERELDETYLGIRYRQGAPAERKTESASGVKDNQTPKQPEIIPERSGFSIVPGGLKSLLPDAHKNQQ